MHAVLRTASPRVRCSPAVARKVLTCHHRWVMGEIRNWKDIDEYEGFDVKQRWKKSEQHVEHTSGLARFYHVMKIPQHGAILNKAA